MKLNTYNKILNFAQTHKKIASKILSISSSSSRSLIDIGGGSGLLLYYLNSSFNKVTILEPSKDMTSHIKDSSFIIINSSIQEFSISKTYDTVVCFDSLHHFSNGSLKKDMFTEIVAGIKKMIALSRNDLIIIEPSMKSLSGNWTKFQENVLFRIGSYFLSKNQFEEILTKLNDELEVHFEVEYEYYLSFLIVHIIKK